MKTHEVYEEDQYGNTWMVAQFTSFESADMFRKKMYGDDVIFKVRPIKKNTTL